MNFSSENFDKTHPEILKALINSNTGFAASYGKDDDTAKTVELFKVAFGTKEIDVFFCFNGTGANNFALSSITKKYNSIFCSDVSHLYVDESTAPETFTGCRLYPVKTNNGKIILDEFLLKIKRIGDVHHPQPAVLSISQPTEYGTVYTLTEVKKIAKHCKENNILLHIDGARIFNAVTAMNCTLGNFTKISCVDVLTVGGTKSGLMFGEAVVFFKSKRFSNFKYNHKRSMQLASKNRFLAVQFSELFREELWKTIANHTNNLAKYFEQEILKIDPAMILYPVETNMVFMKIDSGLFHKLKPFANFYMWNIEREEARLVFSFSNTKKEIDIFLEKYKEVI